MFGFLVPQWVKTLGVGLGVWLVLMVAVTVYGQYKERQGYTRGKAELQAVIDQYERKLVAQKAEDDLARQQLKSDGELVVERLKAQLDTAQAEAQKTKVVVKEVVRYVTEKADANCTVPVGAVWMWNSAIAAESSDAASAVAEGRPTDVDRPSGVALSQAAAVLASNLGECVERGSVIRAWQSWYTENQKLWETYGKSIGPPVELKTSD